MNASAITRTTRSPRAVTVGLRGRTDHDASPRIPGWISVPDRPVDPSGSCWVVSPPTAPFLGERYADDHAQSDRQEGSEQRTEILDAGDRVAPMMLSKARNP